ncbi:hypothetical protein HWV62_17400 [Athelia sp. TMB]|nr:hypothetical protein HWV62_17400 [Athelia sp. TMB]
MASADVTDSQTFNSILKKSQIHETPLPSELSYLIAAFLPSQLVDHRSKAYLVLSSFCQGVRSSFTSSKSGKDGLDPAAESLTKIFAPLVISQLEGDTEQDALGGLTFLTALFQVDWQTASSIILQDGVIEHVADLYDIYPSPQISLEVAHLLGQASGYKPCRAVIPSQFMDWLRSKSRQTSDIALRGAAAIALIKLSRGSAADAADATKPAGRVETNQDGDLTRLMTNLVIESDDKASLADATEGLAYLSTDPSVKEALANDSEFLSRLFGLVVHTKPKTKTKTIQEPNTSLLYGVLVIIANLSAYRPRLSEEDAQLEKLKQMAKAGKSAATAKDVPELDVLDDDEHAKRRCRKLIAGGALDVMTTLPNLESRGIRVSAGKAFLSFVEDKDNRGKILQSGGGKALSQLIRQALSSLGSAKSALLDVTDLDAIQALAKLAITASPVQVFGPNVGAAYDAIRPLTLMLLHPSSTLLQQFESMMALTNLSSQGQDAATKVGMAEGLMNKVELLLLEQHPLVRRAAMELICNLIAGSDAIFERYGGSENSVGSRSKLQVLLALSDVDDVPTRLAASGALATVTSSPSACKAVLELQRERKRVFPILAQLIDPTVVSLEEEEETEETKAIAEPGLVHRGVICTRNILLSVSDDQVKKRLASEAAEAGLVNALANIINGKNGEINPDIAMPTAEILQFLVAASGNA